ncbi:MAG: bifunctional oligoribonuclease/PAP phosphatase NrnA [Schwartzia sp.]|nr:bifunctional oligoribonuclease/PAP phosphatase NrnA [Schwartzia sp. (in: firmicutes)]MBR1886226.1 bifunctional oligoribonuclease/PAP phosphatase NrnA [Schwartzia sp. (in: firmicutes)]
MNITMAEAAEKLMAAKKLLVTAHVNPDGDAIGSTLGLAAFLRGKGKTVTVMIDDKLPKNLAFLPGYDKIARPEAGQVSDAEMLVILDTSLDRIGEVEKAAKGLPVLNIDHHVSNDGKADFLYNAHRAATAEIIFELIDHLGGEFSTEIAVPLYTGMATDTGFFKFSNTRPETMHAAARLLEAGVHPEQVSEALEEKPESVVRGQAAALQTMELSYGGRVAGLYLDRELATSLDTTEGFIDFVRVIEGVEIAVLMKCMDENFCRVSVRSKGLDVSKVAMKFGGGGHIRAAGFPVKKPLAEAKKDVLEALGEVLGEK